MFPFDSVSSFFMDLGSETRGKRNPFVFIKWGVAIKRNAMIEYHLMLLYFFCFIKALESFVSSEDIRTKSVRSCGYTKRKSKDTCNTTIKEREQTRIHYFYSQGLRVIRIFRDQRVFSLKEISLKGKPFLSFSLNKTVEAGGMGQSTPMSLSFHKIPASSSG